MIQHAGQLNDSSKLAVCIRGLRKSYLEGEVRRHVLTDLNGDFAAGEIHAVEGRSGCGKSTLLNLIAGIDVPDKGEIWLAGEPVHDMDERRRTLLRRRNIGIVFQFFNLIPTLTVAENVMLPMELNKESGRKRRVQELLERVGLEDRSRSYPSSLSGGEQQRVAVARAVAHRPLLVLADEPTGNLDDSAARQVLGTLAELRGQCTVIIVTHSEETARVASSRWRLRAGQLREREAEP